jgi:predicted Holliday junction resolvase-like endonuclease
MWIVIFLLIIIILLLTVVYCLFKISDQLKLISEHFNVKEKEIEVVPISDEEIENELEDEFMKK